MRNLNNEEEELISEVLTAYKLGLLFSMVPNIRIAVSDKFKANQFLISIQKVAVETGTKLTHPSNRVN